MIDLTPLDVRKKYEDFKRVMRGFEPQEVQTFLEMVAERMEELVRENLMLRERSDALQKQVDSQVGREQAVQDALVTAQELRSDIQKQAEREAEFILNEARTEARRLVAEAEAEVRSLMRDAQRKIDQGVAALEEMERRRVRFLRSYRQLLERELDVVEVEEAREPLDERAVELELGGGRREADDGPTVEAADGADAGLPVGEEGLAVESAPAGEPAPPEGAAAFPDTAPPPADRAVDELAAEYAGGEGDGTSDEGVSPAGPDLFEALTEPDDESSDRWG